MANGRTKVTAGQVETYLKSGKRTFKDVAEKFNVTAATARKHVLTLVESKTAAKAGTKPTGSRGRPADLYTTA